ncbi:MAG: hypothetical protein ACPGN3_16335 [Opitutales bacterium]
MNILRSILPCIMGIKIAGAATLSPFAKDQVIFHLTLDEINGTTFEDNAGNFDGTLIGTHNGFVDGFVRKGVSFDKTSTYQFTGGVEVASPNQLFTSVNDADFTVSLVTSIEDVNSVGGIYSFGTQSPVDVRYDGPNGGLQMRFWGPGHVGTRVANIIPKSEMQTDTLYFITVVWDKTNLETRGYVNGVLKATLSLESGIDYFNENVEMVIGAIEYNGSYQTTLQGTVDEFVMLNTALEDSAVSDIYEFYQRFYYTLENDRDIDDIKESLAP